MLSLSFLTAQTYPKDFIIVPDDQIVSQLTPIECNSVDANSCPWDNQPIKYVAVNFHYFCNPDGTGNFNEYNDGKTPSSTAWNAYTRAEAMLKEANRQLQDNFKTWNAPEGTPTCKINIMLSLKGVFVHRGNFPPQVITYTPTGNTTDLFPATSFFDNNPTYFSNGGSEMNCFFYPVSYTGNPDPTVGVASGFNTNSNDSNYSCMYGDWEQYNATGNKDPWTFSIMVRLLLHELFHGFGIYSHPKDGDNCADTKNSLNCWGLTNTPPCDNRANISNNLMDYNGFIDEWSLSPCQICIAHQTLENSVPNSWDYKKQYVSFVGNCQRPVALLYGASEFCFTNILEFGGSQTVYIDGSPSTYETSYRLTVVEVTAAGVEIPSTKKSEHFTGEIGRINLKTAFKGGYNFVVDKSYKVTLRVFNTCSEPDEVSKIIKMKRCDITTENTFVERVKSVNVYPNPVIDQINIEYDLGSAANIKIDLLSLLYLTIRLFVALRKP